MSRNQQQQLRSRGVRMREKIEADIVIKTLHNHVLGKVDMTATQVNAARILLNKTLPDLKAVEVAIGSDARSPHALSLDDLLRVIDGEATQVTDSAGESTAGQRNGQRGDSSPHALPASLHSDPALGNQSPPRPATGVDLMGGVVNDPNQPFLSEKISEIDHKAQQHQKHRKFKDLPPPPKGYRYGEVSKNGQSMSLIPIEEGDE